MVAYQPRHRPARSKYAHPDLNNDGEIAFFTDTSGGQNLSGWVFGTPGNLRKGVAFFDEIDGGEVRTLAVSRNPMKELDDCGNLLVWCRVRMENGIDKERMLLITPDQTVQVVVRQGDPSPYGGTVATMQAWPSLNNAGQSTIGAGTPDAPDGIVNAHFLSAIGNRKGDGDDDGIINLEDYALMYDCLAGPAECPPLFECAIFDFNADGLVDLRDYARFQAVVAEP